MLNRRGSYNALLGLMLPIAVGFLALSVDTSWIQLSASQAQDVADAAAHAALIELRRSGDTYNSRLAAEAITAANLVGDDNGKIEVIEFGYWERNNDGFDTTAARPNAVKVEVGRYSDNPISLRFARIWGRDSAEVNAEAIAATRSLHVVLVMDITGSFSKEIGEAAKASVSFLDILSDSHGDDDMMGMSVFTYRFAWEFTPMFFLKDVAARSAARTQWGALNVASKVTDINKPYDFANGGKFPNMPREYKDEPGTDHHVGVVQGEQMIVEQNDPFAYRAMIVLTDGDPNGLDNSSMRDSVPYVESRWREYKGPTPHSGSAIEAESVRVSQEAWDDSQIHIWTVSFRAKRAFLRDMVQGDGKFYYTENSSELTPIFQEIARSMPLLIVK